MSDAGSISFSIITKNKGILTKEFSLTDEGELKKDSSKCKLAVGFVKRIDIDFDEVGDVLAGLQLNQAITLGVPRIREGQLVAADLQDKHPEAITRTKENFSFNRSGFMIYFDYDPDPQGKALSKEELINELRHLHPALKTAAMLWRPSASSFIYHDDEQLSGLTGQHVYVPCKNPENLEAFIATLKAECWFKELGWIMVSAAGTALERVIFDSAVFSPERLVFEAGAELAHPLTQKLPEAEYFPGRMIDLNSVELLNPSMIAPAKNLIAKKKDELSKEILKVRKEYIKRQAEALAESTGVKVAKARKIIDGRYEGTLLSQDALQADDGSVVLVRDILSNPDFYVGMTFRDPLEPDYGKCKAKIFVNEDGSVICNSFAHGGRTFRLKHDNETFDEWLQSADIEEIEERWKSMVMSAADSAVAESKLLEKLKLKLNVGLTALKQDLREFKKERSATMKSDGRVSDNYLAGLTEPDEDSELTHDQIAELFIKQMPKDIVGAEGVVYQYNGKCVWEGLDLTDIQQLMVAKFDGVARCTRKADYKAISAHIYDKVRNEKFFANHRPCFATPSACYIVDGRDIVETGHDSKYKIRHLFRFDADPNMKIPMFLEFLDWAFQNDPKQVLVMQEVFGGILFGLLNYYFHKAVLFKGPGANGKGVVFNIIRSIVPPEYVCAISPFRLVDGPFMAGMAGKLLNLVPELPAHKKIPGEMFKQIVDSSIISARRLYQPPFEFVPIASQIFSSNYFIDSDDASEGMFRRWLLIGFDSVVEEKDRIGDYGNLIAQEEGPGILAWALEGAVRLLEQNGFTETKTHKNMMVQWRMRVDPVIGFISDEDWVRHAPESMIGRDMAYRVYDDWCDAAHHRKLGKQEFVTEMDKRFSLIRHKGEWCYQGLQLIKEG
ncbi:MAG: phage/plasmid primase, P4 family [Candidatus Neomarinimicrobiota bacterium]